LHDRALLLASVLLGLIVFAAVFGPLVWERDPLAINVGAALQAPSLTHPMGTDSSGRDVLARFDEGARISLLAALSVVVLGGLVGCAIGLLAGMSDAFADNALMRAMDSILAFPVLMLAMAVSIGLGPSLEGAVIGIAIGTVPYYARLLRSEVIRIRRLPHVEAAHALGARSGWIVRRHILPHTVSTMFIQSAAVFGYAILTLAGLGFVGLGAQIPTPEWGAMISDGQQYALSGQWWIAVFPGLGLLCVVTATNIVADRARAMLNPRFRRFV
jgi:peptide/nickel transport system permease protein